MKDPARTHVSYSRRSSGLSVPSLAFSARLSMRDIPLLPNVQQMAAEGMVTGASGRNWAGYGHEVELAATITAAQKALLTDPQTSGGLLVSCTADRADAVLEIFKGAGFGHAAVIGEMQRSGNCKVAVA